MVGSCTTAGDRGEESAPVDLPAMSDTIDVNDALAVPYVSDNSVVANAISPKTAEARALQGFANRPRVFRGGYAGLQERKNAAGGLRVELAKFSYRARVELNLPCHIL